MSDKIKRAARERMARTGEKYTVARRAVIAEHQASKVAEAEAQGAGTADTDA